ncbi:MAG: DUF6600 domain-containing protein [Candidatus Acidiferrum sp.]
MTKTNFRGKGRVGLLLCLTGLLCVAAPKARAGQGAPDQAPPEQTPQGQVAQSDAGSPPTRVARISFVDGSVSIQPGGTGDWGSAPINRPMTIGDKLWTDKDARAELQTGVVSIHLGSMTALSFLNLDQAISQMRVAEGSVNFRVKEIREGDLNEVDTPNAVFTVKQAGAFRIDVSENGDSTGITVIRGAGQVTAGGKIYDLQAGQRGVFNGTNEIQSTIAQAPPADGLDQWSNDRDLREQDSVSSRYVPPDMPGTADLDNNGTWSEQPDTGAVWYPNDVPQDWAPYSDGYWSSIGPWGWTWVGYEPWGFAPYHYGRWGLIGGRWGWCPGPIIGHAFYGPAFVGFLGGGFGFGFGVGFGVGWFPLGFGEPFHPWYHAGFGYVERVNFRNTAIRNAGVLRAGGNFNYAYAHNTRAVTATSRTGFASGQAVNRGADHFSEASLKGAEVRNPVGVSPSRESSLGAANARGNVSHPPASVENRSVMARTAPASAASHLSVHAASSEGLRPANTGRAWSAQGHATDRGRAPEGFGSSRSSNDSGMTARTNRQDRPPWAGSGASGNRETSTSGNRSYTAPQRTTGSSGRTSSAPSRTYSAPGRSYGGNSGSHASGSSSHASAPHGGGGGGGGHPHR